MTKKSRESASSNKGGGSVAEEEAEKEPMTGNEKVVMAKRLGLFDGVAMNVGAIIGSGIFISPKGVLQSAGSPALSIIVWALCGVVTFLGAICYAELGTMINRSGGNYAYLGEAFGPLPSFLFLWAALLIIVPVSNAINALAFANYLLLPIWGTCAPSDPAVLIVGALAVGTLCVINCWSVNWAVRLQTLFMVAKVLPLAIVIITGFVCYFIQGETKGLQEPFANTSTDPSLIALSFYSGLFSYTGWNALNSVVEELRNPYRNLPRAIGISIPAVTLVYVLANVAYLVILTPEEIISSPAVALSFSEKVFPSFAWVVSVLVALSALGALHCNIYFASRIFFVGARNGHLPTALALINLENLTPIPAIIFFGLATTGTLLVGDVYILINYCIFVDAAFLMATVGGLLWLRWKKPDFPRPIKVNLFFPITFFAVSIFLVCFPVFSNPIGAAIGMAITATAVPVFFVCIAWKTKPRWISKANSLLTTSCQKIFMAVPDMAGDK